MLKLPINNIKIRYLNYIKIVAIINLFVFFSACKNEITKNNKITIVATTGMIGDLLVNLVKDSAKVDFLMQSGIDPHLYKATQADLHKLYKADLIFYSGLHLEGKMTEVLEKYSRIKKVYSLGDNVNKNSLIKVSDNINPNTEIHYDPHIWFDLDIWLECVELAAKKIILEYPHLEKYITNNKISYIKQLNNLKENSQKSISQIPKKQRILITSHDAFSYFGRKFDIQVRGLQGISTVAEYGIKDVNNLVDFVIANNIKTIFSETSVSSKSMEAILYACKKQNYKLQIYDNLYSDSMGNTGTVEGTYIGMYQKNIQTIVKGLQ